MAFEGAFEAALNGAPGHRVQSFMHVEFSALNADEALDAIAARASLGGPFAYVATPNVDHIVGLAEEPARHALYDGAWLTLNDSRVLAALATRAGQALPAVPGADLAERLFDEIIERHEPVTIIGGDAAAIAALQRRYGLTDVRWHKPPRGLKADPAAIVAAAAFAAAQQSRFTLICVGAPQQEMIAYAIQARGDATGVGLCVGAAVAFLAGAKARAPRWIRALGLEWAFRLASEPGRLWRRYLVEGPKVFALFAAWRAEMAAASAA